MFQGSFVAIVTPMQDNGSIDFQCYENLVHWHIEQGTHGIVVTGTTGESPTVTDAERVRLIELAVKIAAGRVPVIAGAGSNSTAHTIELIKEAMMIGVDGCLVVTPYYNKPTQEGLYQHFRAVARSAEVPIILYNVPSRTGCDLLPETTVRLSSESNIVAIKDATGDISRVSKLKEAGLSVLSGDDATALALLEAGGDGVISVVANVVPDLFAAMCDHALAGELELARSINAKTNELSHKLFVEANPIPVKWLLHELGKIPRGIRLPLTELSASYREIVKKAYLESRT